MPSATGHTEHIMRTSRRCISCGAVFTPRPNIPNQRYCSSTACQQQRRYEWHKRKLHTDSDYLVNQQRAQSDWQARHPDYWRNYRQSHPEYCQRNRDLQRIRDTKHAPSTIAKMDASPVPAELLKGLYLIRFVGTYDLANMDEHLVKITAVSSL